MQTVKLFISSPGDLIPERNLCKQVFKSLEKRFEPYLRLELFFWEDEPVLASDTFQTQFPRAADSDIFICLLWSRIGTPLPKGSVFSDGTLIVRADGSEYESGTIAEFEDALNAYQRDKTPAILMYFKRTPVELNAQAPDFLYKSKQRHGVEQFFNKWFQDEQGRYPRGHSEFKNLTAFAKQLERHVCKLLHQRFLAKSLQHLRFCHSDWQGNPFLGLATYQTEHSRIYFGRDLAINDIYAALQQQAQAGHPFVMILGQSGSGKSSLLQAGVLPLFEQLKVPNFIFRPAFAAQGNGKNLWHSLRERLPKHLPANDSRDLPYAVIYIDQFEELFTLEQFDHQARRYFFTALNKLVQNGKIWLLASMRSEFLAQLSDYPQLSTLLSGRGRYLLLPPSPSEIYRMITEPAARAGLVFEKSPNKKALNQLIFDAIATQPYSLALLSFALNALYQQREKNLLTYAAYKRIGGLQGALSGYAVQVYAELSASQQTLLRSFIRSLVKVNKDSGQGYSARAISIKELSQTPAQQQLLQRLVNSRLFSSAQGPQGLQVIRITHEALLNHWPLLKEWLAADRAYLLIRDRINEAANRWQQAQQHADLLLPEGKPLVEALELLQHWREVLSETDIAYIEQSEQVYKQKAETEIKAAEYKLKRSRQIIALFAVFNILLFISVYIAYQQSQEARAAQYVAELEQKKAKRNAEIAEQEKHYAQQEKQRADRARHKTQRTQALFLADLARQANQKGDHTLASLLALEGLPNTIEDKSRPLVPELAQQLYQAYSKQRGQAQIELSATPLKIAYHPQGKELAIGDLQGRIWRWQVQDGQHQYKPLILNDWGVTQLLYSPDGKALAASSEDGLIKIWQLESGTLQSQLILAQRINHFEFSPDGEQIAIASGDESLIEGQGLHLWDWRSKTQSPLVGHAGAVMHLDYSPDGKRLLSAGLDKLAILWSVRLKSQEHSLYGHQTALTQVLFSPDQKRLLSTDMDGRCLLWDGHGRLLAQRAAHSSYISSAAFSPDSRQFATASWDGQIYTWYSDSAIRQHVLHGHQDEVYHLDYSPNSKQLLSSSNDHSVRLWDSQNGRLITPLQAHSGRVYQAKFSPNGELIASIGGQLWQEQGNQLNLWRNQVAQQHFATAQDQLLLLNQDKLLLSHQAKQARANIWDPRRRELLAQLNTGLSLIYLMVANNAQDLIFIGRNRQHKIEWQRWTKGDKTYVLAANKLLDKFESLALSPDKRTLITGHRDGGLQLWRMHNGSRKNTLKIQNAAIQHIAFAEKGEQFVAADRLGRIHHYVMNPQGRYRSLSEWKIETPVKQIAIEQDWLLALNHTALYRHSLTQVDKQQRLSAPAKQNWHSFALSPNKHTLALLSKGKQTLLHYWPWQTQNLLNHAQTLTWSGSQQWLWLDNHRLLNIDKQQHLQIWHNKAASYQLQTWQEIQLSKQTILKIQYDAEVLFALDKQGVVHRYPIYENLAQLLENSRNNLLRQLSPAEKRRFFLDDVSEEQP